MGIQLYSPVYFQRYEPLQLMWIHSYRNNGSTKGRINPNCIVSHGINPEFIAFNPSCTTMESPLLITVNVGMLTELTASVLTHAHTIDSSVWTSNQVRNCGCIVRCETYQTEVCSDYCLWPALQIAQLFYLLNSSLTYFALSAVISSVILFVVYNWHLNSFPSVIALTFQRSCALEFLASDTYWQR